MIRAILGKELSDHWRDRRSVLGAMLLPILGPVLLVFSFSLIEQYTSDRVLEVPVIGAEHAPQLIDFLRGADAEIVEAPADPDQALLDGDVPLVLKIGPDYSDRLAESRSAPVQILVDASNQKNQRDIGMLRQLLGSYSEQLAARRLIVRGVSPSISKPLSVREINVSSPERSGMQLLGMVPLFLILVTFTGGMNVAIDATAGERERRSLEPLLLNPVSRGQVVAGKWLATSLFALAILVIATVGFVVTVHFMDTSALGITVKFGAREALPAYALLAPLALLAAALQMLVATFARSFKEAQTYLAVFSLLPIAPALYMMLNPGTTELWMMFVPALAQVAAITEVLGGDALPSLHLAIVWVTSALYCSICLFVLARLFQHEEIIFGH